MTYYSLIFSSDIDKGTIKLSLFKKSFQDIRRDIVSGQNIATSLFGKSITKNDVQYITDFMQQIDKGVPLTQAWNNIMTNASVAGKKMAVSVKSGKVALDELSTGMDTAKIAATALNMALNVAFAIGVSLIIQGISKAINYYDDLADKVNEVTAEYKESQDSIQSHSKTISEISDRYKELATGVDTLGNNVSLTSDEFDEYNSICNQIADMYPSLIQGWTEEGNAILTLKGNVDDLAEAYRQEQIAANNALLVKSKDIFKNANHKQDKLNEVGIWEYGTLTTSAYKDFKKLLSNSDLSNTLLSEYYDTDKLAQILKHQMNIDIGDLFYLSSSSDKYKTQLAEIIKENEDTIRSYLDMFEIDMENAVAEKKTFAEAYLSNQILKAKDENTKTKASELSSEIQNILASIINNIDYDTASTWENYADAERYVNNLINKLGDLSSFEQDKITTYLDIQTKYNGNECTVKEYNDAIDDFYTAISSLDEDIQKQIKIALGVENDTQFERVKNNFSEEYHDWIDSLTKSELNIVENLLLDTSAADWSLDQWKSKVEGQNSIEVALNFNIENAEKNAETLQKSVQEALTGNYGLSKESRSVFTSLFGDLDNFDANDLFERTANGIRLNTDELNKLEKQQSDIQKQKFDIALKELYKEYNELTKDIENCSDVYSDEYNNLIDSRNAVVDKINSVADLQSEYDGLTSAYMRWQNALANGEDGDMYDNIRSEYEKAKELYDKRLVGTSEFESYMDLVHPRDNGESWGSASYDEIIKGWQEVGKEIQNTGYSMQDFLKDDEKGVMNFLEATSKIKDSGITKDGNFFNIDVENTEELAKRLGVSVDFIETMFKKLKDYKFDINFYDESEEYLRSVSVALEAAQKLKDLKLTDINFDFTTTDTESLIKQIETIAKVYDKFKKSDGSIDLSIEGAVEAKEVYTQLLRQKQKLEAPIYMSIDTSQVNDNGVRDKLQEVKDITKTYNEIELKAILGDDTSELERQLNKQIRNAVKNKNSVLYGVTFEADEVSYAEVEEKINEYFGTDDGKALLISAGVDSAQLEDEAKTLKSTIQNALSGITIRLGFDKNGLKFTIDTSEADKDVEKFQNQTKKRVFIPALNLDTSEAEKQANTFFSGLQNQLNKKYTATVNVNTSGSPTLDNLSKNSDSGSPTLDNLSKNSDSGYKKSILYQGTHKLQGTAKADGDWGAKKTEDSLLGEIAPELWVHSDTGTWELVDKPQFRKVKKGDVIFNGDQTKDLMKRGIINSFGQSFLNGTAYGNGVGGGGSVIVSTGSSGNSNTSPKSSSNSKSPSKDKEEELKAFDWIEVAIDRIERAIDRLKNTATSTYKALKTKLGATTSEISKVNQELSLQQKAYNRYIKEANSVGLSSGLATKVRNGTIDINKYSSETQELIKDYQEWYEKALDCKDAIQDLHETLSSLYEDKFNDIQNDYDNQLELLEHLTNSYNTGIDKLEAKGYLESTKYYSALQNVEKQNIAIMNKELKDLEKSFSEAMNSGEIEKYSDSWYDMQISINEVKESIDEANVSLLEYSKTMREI